jgi:hypothetical protein
MAFDHLRGGRFSGIRHPGRTDSRRTHVTAHAPPTKLISGVRASFAEWTQGIDEMMKACQLAVYLFKNRM